MIWHKRSWGRRCFWCFLHFFGVGCALVSSASAVEPTSTLLLYNSNDADSIAIQDHYLQVHPGVRSLGLNLTGLGEEITAQVYLDQIREPVFNYLESQTWGGQIDTLVTTKGLPLRINAGAQPVGNTSARWRSYSSLESELARLDSIDSIDQMGDQVWEMSQLNIPNVLPANPYYLGLEFDLSGNPVPYAGPVGFDRSDPINEGIRLTARLDAFTLQDVLDMIDRSQSVIVVPNGNYIAIDDDPNAVAFAETEMAELAQVILPAQGQLASYDITDNATTSSPVPLIGYISHGVNDGPGGLETEYIENQLGFELARGAVFQSYESFNAMTFVDGSSQNQGLIAEWIAIGGSAGLGQVWEPYARRENITNENIFYDMLLSGFTLSEAAWAATRQLSYVNTVVGDPLMVWQPFTPGDFNLDGVVNLADVNQFIQAMVNRSAYDALGYSISADILGDMDDNGLLDLGDLSAFSNLFAPPAPMIGDMNGDGVVNPDDASLLVLALVDPAGYDAMFPLLDREILGDVNVDGTFDLGDLSAFGGLLTPATGVASATSVPEPGAFILAGIGLINMWLVSHRKRRG